MAIAKSRHEYKFSVNEKDLLMLGMRLEPLIAPMWESRGITISAAFILMIITIAAFTAMKPAWIRV